MAEPQKLKIETGTNSFTMKGRPCELSAFSFIPTERDDPPERTVFNTPKQVFVVQEIYLNYHVYTCAAVKGLFFISLLHICIT